MKPEQSWKSHEASLEVGCSKTHQVLTLQSPRVFHQPYPVSFLELVLANQGKKNSPACGVSFSAHQYRPELGNSSSTAKIRLRSCVPIKISAQFGPTRPTWWWFVAKSCPWLDSDNPADVMAGSVASTGHF